MGFLSNLFTRRMSTVEARNTIGHNQALGRYHAQNALSFTHLKAGDAKSIEYMNAAKQRLQTKLGPQAVQVGSGPDPVSSLLSSIVEILEGARLTTNFNVSSWFTQPVTGDHFENMFERPHSLTSGAFQDRDKAERAMFTYHAHSPQSLAQVPGTKTPEANPMFIGNTRPKYAALDFLKWHGGGAPGYGHDFFVLKHYVRFNCSYTPGDSLHETGSSRVVTYPHLVGLVTLVPDKTLDMLIQAATSMAQGIRNPAYIEAQIHMDVMFSRDVEAVHVQSSSLYNAEIKKNFEAFVKRTNMKVVTVG